MKQQYHRRAVIAAFSAFLSGVAGCFDFSDEARVIGIFVINQTDEHLTAEIEIREDDTVLAEVRVDLPDERPDTDGTHSSVLAQVSVADISEGTELTAEIGIDEHWTETVDFVADCDIDGDITGDEVSFYIQDDYVDTRTGRCTSEGLPH